MNNTRRKQIKSCIARFKNTLNDFNSIISDEEYAFENIPENLQSSMRSEEMQDNIDTMYEISDSIENALIDLEDIIG